jgi:small subunit ribosomal protein S8
MVNDLISDTLTRIRNANLKKHDVVWILNTKTNRKIIHLLQKEGFIKNFTLIEKAEGWVNGALLITLKYLGHSKKPCITHLKRLSSPSLRFYSSYKDIPTFLNGMGVVILTTSKGFMTDRTARALKIGGEILFSIW